MAIATTTETETYGYWTVRALIQTAAAVICQLSSGSAYARYLLPSER